MKRGEKSYSLTEQKHEQQFERGGQHERGEQHERQHDYRYVIG